MSLSERCSLLTLAYHSIGEVKGETMENKYYVYLHRIIGTNEVFNVGSGCGERMKSTRNRSKSWNSVVENKQWIYSIVKEKMSQADAQTLEVDLIKLYKPVGNIHRTTIEAKSLNVDAELICSKFYYDATSPTGLRYKIDNNQTGSLKRNSGDIAGHLSQGRYVVKVNNTNRKAHRIVWFLMHNDDPIGFVIDHIDGNSLNNKIENLRKVTQECNSKNTKVLNKNNLTGYKGVSLHNGLFTANYRLNGKVISKHFPVAKYGEELALALAVEYRYVKMKELIENGGILYASPYR